MSGILLRVGTAAVRRRPVRAPDTPATRRFVLLGAVTFLAVATGCLVSGRPAEGRWWLLGVLLVLAAAAWAMALLVRPADWRIALACYLVFGLAGCGVDLVQSAGPAFVLGYMALAGIGLAVPRRPSMIGGAVMLVALGGAEAVTSDQPGAAALAVGLGAAFLFVAAQFAALSRDVQQRSAEMVAQAQRERATQASAAALAERSRLARELHDVLAHTLSGLALQLEATRVYATRSGADPALVEQVTVAHKLARQGMTSAKQAIAALRGAGTPGLADVPRLVEEFRRTTGLPAELTVTGTPHPLTSAHQLAAYRTVQEALSNVAKHEPAATSVPVQIDWTDLGVRVRVSNTRDPAGSHDRARAGVGAPGAPAGFGLTGIAERTAMLGGSLSCGPTPDGFEVLCELPRAPVPLPESDTGLVAATAGAPWSAGPACPTDAPPTDVRADDPVLAARAGR